MLAQVSEGWRDFGTWVGIVTATVVLLGLIARSKIGRWLAKQIVGTPLREWIQHEAVEPLLRGHEARITESMTHAVRQSTIDVIREHTANEETLAGELVGIVGRLDGKIQKALDVAQKNGQQVKELRADVEALKAG